MAKKIDDDDLWWLGFDSNCGRLLAGSGTEEELRKFGVPWGSTVGLVTRPQVPFRGTRLLIHRPVASSFLIHSVRVELFKQDRAYELKVNKGGAELLGMPLCLPNAQPGTDILILIENIGPSKIPLRFIAGMLGVGNRHGC